MIGVLISIFFLPVPRMGARALLSLTFGIGANGFNPKAITRTASVNVAVVNLRIGKGDNL